jgi:4-alpha-glucanotransferase
VLQYVRTDGTEINWDLIRLAMSSTAEIAILPVQDILGLDTETRMNTPGTSDGNWRWRMSDDAWVPEVAGRLADLTEFYAR